MDDTPEEFLGLVDPAPPSPSVFLDLPPTPHGDGDPSSQPQDDLALDYISRMLMEDMDDRFFYQYHNHPALLQAPQSLVHVLSSPSSSSVHTNDTSSKLCPDMMQGSAFLAGEADNTDLSGDVRSSSSDVVVQNLLFSHNAAEEAENLLKVGNGDQTVLSLAPLSGAENLSSGENFNVDMLNMAFLMGMEEANKFLPRDQSLVINPGASSRDFTVGQANVGMAPKEGRRNGRDDLEAETGRKSKLIATAEPEEVEAREMINRMMLDGCAISTKEMEELRAAMEKEAEDKNNSKQAARRIRARGAAELRVDLRTLLIHCAQAVMDDRHGAHELLKKIKQHASPTGDATQRLAHCFAEGLEARLAGTGSHVYRSLMAKRTSVDVNLLKAYRLFSATSCFKNVAFTFANKTILHATAGRSRLHIVDYGLKWGFQWPYLLRWLAAREGGPPEVRITGIDLPLPGFRPAKHIEETGHRLSIYAREFGVPFKFHAIAAKWHTIHVEDLNVDPDEVLVVNGLFSFMSLVDDSVVVDSPSPRDVVLSNIRKMRPDVFVHGVVNRSCGTFFLARFREALFYHSDMFDVLEATMPRESDQRLVLERDVFGPCVLKAIACEGVDRTDRSETYRQWQDRNRRAGLRLLPLNREVVETVRETVRKHQYHREFVIEEDRRWLLQVWKGRTLYAHSARVRDDTFSELPFQS